MKIHEKSAATAESEMRDLSYLASDSFFLVRDKKQFTSAISSLQKLYFQLPKLSLAKKTSCVTTGNKQVTQACIDASEIKIDLSRDGLLGRGGFESVRIGTIDHIGFVAIKVLLFRGCNWEIARIESKFTKEIELLHYVNHQNIVRTCGYSFWKNSTAVIMEYLPGGSLREWLLSKSEGGELLVPEIPDPLCL